MIVRELLTRIGYKVDKSAEKKANASFDRLKRGAQALAAALVTGVVAQGFRRMIDAASDVEETMNVVTTAFEDQTQAVLQWAKASGEASGRSEYAMRQYAATLGAVVGPTLGSAEATAELSTNMAQLAVDLGSFFNATDQEALDALRSGLIGQAEPLLRFGVAMNVAALDAFALEKGLGKSTKQMSQAEKIQLRYSFILDRTSKAQGDAAKTAGSYANLAKRLEGNVYDLQVALGETLMPAAIEVVKAMSETAKVIAGPVKAALKAIIGAFKFAGALVVGLGQAFIDLETVGKGILLNLLFWTLAMFAPWILFPLLLGTAIAGAVLILDDLWQALTTGGGVLAGLLHEFTFWLNESDSVLTAFGQVLKNAIDFWAELLFGWKDTSQTIGDWFTGMINGWIDAVGFFGDAAGEHFREVIILVNELLDAVMDFVNSDVLNTMLDAVGLVSDLGLGDLAKTFGLAGPEQISVPGSPAAAAAGGVNANQTIEVNVNAPGGDGPAIANAVAPAVGRAAGDANRRTAQQLLVGGAS